MADIIGELLGPWQQGVQHSGILGIDVWQLFKQILEIGESVETVLLRGLREAIGHRAGVGTACGVSMIGCDSLRFVPTTK